MRLQLFKAIADQLKAQVPAVQFVDLWNEQLATLQAGKAWPLPAVFVEFDVHSWRGVGMGVREADIPVILHIVTRAADYNGNRDRRMDAALSYLQTIEDIDNAVEGLRGPNFASLMLVQSFPNHSHGELVENVEQFVTRARDASGGKKVQKVVLTAQLTTK